MCYALALALATGVGAACSTTEGSERVVGDAEGGGAQPCAQGCNQSSAGPGAASAGEGAAGTSMSRGTGTSTSTGTGTSSSDPVAAAGAGTATEPVGGTGGTSAAAGAGGDRDGGAGGDRDGGAGGDRDGGAGDGDADAAPCAVATRLDACCFAAAAATRAELDADECLVALTDLGRADQDGTKAECWRRSGCVGVACGMTLPFSRVAERDAAGACEMVDECATDADCVVATDVSLCCSCPEAYPASLSERFECLYTSQDGSGECDLICDDICDIACPTPDPVRCLTEGPYRVCR